MNRDNLLLVGVAVLALAAGMLLSRSRQPETVSSQDFQALDASFADVAAMPQALSQWQGKLLVINFWATWCPPCREEIPEFIRLQDAYRQQGLQVIGIALDDRQAVVEYVQAAGINYPVLVAGNDGSAYARKLGNVLNAVPFTVVIDRPGRVVHRHAGAVSGADLRDAIAPLLVSP